jgi:class 3 adenylate cyclase
VRDRAVGRRPLNELLDTLRALGLPEEAIDRAIARGDPEGAIFETVLLAQAAERTVTAAEIEERGGPRLGELETFIEAFGLPWPGPEQPAFTPAEADVFVELERLRDVWPPEIALQVARAYGRLLARIAQTEVDSFRVYVEPRLRAEGADPLTGLLAVQQAFAQLLPLADPLLVGIHRRWLEYELAQAAVTEAGARGALPGAVEIAVLFVDLKDFTAYADTHGDEAAVAAIDRLAATVAHERGPCRFQKSLGDGVMLCYADVPAAVSAARRIIAAMHADSPPAIHASIHCGPAILREGDYFGGAVNVAARLLGIAEADQLVATRQVIDVCGDAFAWEPAGAVRIRGVAQPVEVFRMEFGS